MPGPARPPAVRILLLGGTGEAFRLAVMAAAHGGLEVISSFAGRTRRPRLPPGRIRIGGFGGAAGLEGYLRRSGTDAVVDATHPFARQISAHAQVACAAAACPLLVVERPAQAPIAGSLTARDLDEALRLAGSPAGRILVTFDPTGHGPFRPVSGVDVLFRTLEVPRRLPEGTSWTPFVPGRSVAEERALLGRLRIGALVAKASGGEAALAKLAAAADRDLRIVLLRRPDPPRGRTVHDLDAALAWMLRQRPRTGSG